MPYPTRVLFFIGHRVVTIFQPNQFDDQSQIPILRICFFVIHSWYQIVQQSVSGPEKHDSMYFQNHPSALRKTEWDPGFLNTVGWRSIYEDDPRREGNTELFVNKARGYSSVLLEKWKVSDCACTQTGWRSSHWRAYMICFLNWRPWWWLLHVHYSCSFCLFQPLVLDICLFFYERIPSPQWDFKLWWQKPEIFPSLDL